MLLLYGLTLLCVAFIMPAGVSSHNTTYTNPILPGWNSDPSCVFVKELDNTFFCTTSSFLSFPGIPVYASKDLQNWKLASHALSRPEQLPELSHSGTPSEGTWASTIRYHNGTIYLITAYISWYDGWHPQIRLFSTTDPYDDASWGDPVIVENPGNDIDPDLFFDDDGKVYMSVAAGIWLSEIDLATGAATEPLKVWNGTGNRNPEGPHFYKKDGFYYLLIGEGGTETNHSATIARATNIQGPYEAYAGNPLLTAKDTDDYFQTVGHADLFQDASGNWWGACLATRSGPAWEIYPMGRETVLFPVTWEQGEWPVVDPIGGRMSGPLPPVNKQIPKVGPFLEEPEAVDFTPGSKLPGSFLFWRPPAEPLFTISPPEHNNSLKITPSRVNLTTDAVYDPTVEGMGFVARKQTATLFDLTVDLLFTPTEADVEAGVTVFLTEYQHMDLGITLLSSSNGSLVPSLRFRAETSGKPNVTTPEENIVPIPSSWSNKPVRISVSAKDDSSYTFTASSASRSKEVKTLGSASAEIVSGGSGPFTGKRIFPLFLSSALRLASFGTLLTI
jgi:beta-xylosidase